MKNAGRITALVLSVVMLLGLMPAAVFAEGSAVGGLFTNSQLSIAVEKNSTLAPGVTQDAYTVYDVNGDQVKMFITTADMSVDTVKLFTSYKDMDPTNYGMSKLTEQVASFNEKAAAGDEYYQGTVVAGINSSYYNMINGKPTGTFVMNGIDVTTESEGNAYGYFAVMKDGSVKIGNKGDYSADKGNIQEAIGIYTMLIVDGQICSGLNTTQKYPRQTIGITADGDVILMTADGNQAPKSIGLTVLEQAQVMLDLGCVWAGHLDGGGSCTYAAKPEGSNDFVIVNSPSDGSERSISNGFIIASTAVSDGSFDSAVLSAENEYVTPGASVTVSAKGVDSVGGPAELPENLSWQLADASFGTVENGVFVSGGKTGAAVVQATVDGVVVGETTINVVIPDAIEFNSAEITVPFGKSVALEITATYGVKDVAVKPADFKFVFTNAAVGTLNGFNFTACEENAEVTGSDLTATLVYDESITAVTKLTLGKGSEVVYDFENGTNQGVVIDETPGTKYNYVWPESDNYMVTAENGKVHSGNYALASNINYGNSLESGYMKTSIYSSEQKVFENAVGVGAWIYISDEWVGLWARWTLQPVTVNADGTYTFSGSLNSNTMDTAAGGTGYVYTFNEPGWHYLYADTSAYSAVGWKANAAMIQFYISDRDGSAYGYVASEQSNIPGKYTVYVDDITVDYSSAVDDREAPVFSNITYATEGMPDAAVLNNQTVSANKVTFGASVADYTGKTNFTGVDASTVKAYIDGVEYAATYANGIVSVNDVVLDNGKHVVKFGASDKMGNYGYVYGYITVNAEESGSTVKLVPTDASLTYPKLGSIYNMDLVATAIEEVKSVKVTIDLDNNSTWQLDHMTLADGFEAKYAIDATENVAVIEITRTGANDKSGEAAIATLPVRVWSLKTGYTYPNGTKAGQAAYTYAQYKTSLKEFWRMSVIATVDCGVLTRVDNTVSTFSGERVFCDTEMWANYGNMTATQAGKDYYNSWDGGHVHTAEAIDDKASTCTENGYTDRTFCAGCNSVIDWGTTVSATGHDYEVVDGVLGCDCGEKFNGVYTDGKTYVDGVVIADGWTAEFEYYVNGVKLTGLQIVDGYYYDFGDDGVCENKAKADGFCYNESADAYMYIVAGVPTTGDISINLVGHSFDENGYAYSGDMNILGYTCTFDDYGVFVSAENASIIEAGCVGTNLQYVLFADGNLYLAGEGAMRDYTVNGSYGPWFYNNLENVKYVTIGAGVTSIGEYAFNRCAHIKTVAFEENSVLETISKNAFRACHRLDSITIPASVVTIDDYAFFKCGALTTINFAADGNLKYIGREAFAESHYLNSISIPASVTTIGERLFIRSKTSVTMKVVNESMAYYYAIDNGISYELVDGVVPPLASGDCTDTITWNLYPNGTLEIVGSGAMPNYSSQAGQPWAAKRSLVKKIVIGKDITAIGNYAFAYCENTEEIVFAEGSVLESIGVLSFRSARKVTEVVLPETVTSLNTYAFGTCTALVNVYIPQGMKSMHTKAFVESTNVVLSVAEDTYAEQYAVSNGINHTVRKFVPAVVASGTCGDSATWTFTSDGVMTISGSGAMTDYADASSMPWYAYLKQIKHIVIGKDITSVGNYAFAYANNVQTVTFEEGSKLTKIGNLSFFYMLFVTEVQLPETVTYLGSNAFGYCTKLVDVYMPQEMTYIHFQAFRNCPLAVLNVAEGSYAAKYAVQYGISYTTRPFIAEVIASGTCGDSATWTFTSDGVMTISGSGAMTDYADATAMPWYAYLKQIKHIVIGKDITSVGNYAFAYANNVQTVTFEEGSKLTKIGNLSFFYMLFVTEVQLPETVTYLGSNAFGYCTKLVDVYMPQEMTYIHFQAFRNCPLAVLNVAEGSYAAKYAVQYGISYTTRPFIAEVIASGTCGDSATWTLTSDGVMTIGGSGAMTDYGNATAMPWYAYLKQIKHIVIGKDITSVGNYAFAYAHNVQTVTFEEGSQLTRIGVLSFFYMLFVTEVDIPDTVNFIGSNAFGYCTKLENVDMPTADGLYVHGAAFKNTPYANS